MLLEDPVCRIYLLSNQEKRSASRSSCVGSVRPSSRNPVGFLAVLQPNRELTNTRKKKASLCVIALAKGETSLNRAPSIRDDYQLFQVRSIVLLKTNLP